MYREYLFAPIRHVAFFEQSLKLTDAHAIQHSELGHALTILTLQVLPHLFLILRTHLCCGGGGGRCTIGHLTELTPVKYYKNYVG